MPGHIATVKQNTPPHSRIPNALRKRFSLIFMQDSGNNPNTFYDLLD